MTTASHTRTKRAPRERETIRWCPHCRDVGASRARCVRCPLESASTVPLVRGLASVELASESGLVRYHGEQSTRLVGLGLLSMIPLAAACALAWELTWLATLLLGTSFVGLPTLAFVDARRAGAMRTSDPAEMPPSAPELPESTVAARPPASADTGSSAPHERRPLTVMSGAATALGPPSSAPLTDDPCLAFRLDIRAGQDTELVARYTSPTEFAITCDDGTQMLVSGIIELTARAYQAIAPAHQARFQVAGTELLPALFSHGGWACELALRHGDTIRVEGVVSDERRDNPLGVSYRQPATMAVLRGEPGHPVVVALVD